MDYQRILAIDPEGYIYVPDSRNHRVRKISIGDRYTEENIFVEPSGIAHKFSDTGLHLQTFDLDSGVVLLEFEHDYNDNLIGIIDRFGNKTRIERNGLGVITGIISPDNLRTELTVNQDFLLTDVDYADTSHYGFEYTSEGLMIAKVEPKGNRFERIFDTSGRVTDAMDAEGGHWQFDSS